MRKIVLLCTVLAFACMLKAQDSIAFNFTFNHMALSVKDVEVSVAFYKKVFQFTEITNRSAIEGIRWLSMTEGKELHLISIIKEPVTVNKALHLSFATQNFDAFVKHLEEMNIAYSDWPGKPNTVNKRADGVKQIYFSDPDGYWIEVNNGYAAVPSIDQVKNEVWQKEVDYWNYVNANDLTSYLILWDEKFIGYPTNNIITYKDHITDWIGNLYKDKNRHFKTELVRKIENVYGDIAIVLYDVNYTWTNEKGKLLKKEFNKITHTWKKTDKGWVIIGGMGASK